MCSSELGSYLAWYLDGSDTSPLFLLQVTVGFGSPVTIALKKANFPENRNKRSFYFFFFYFTANIMITILDHGVRVLHVVRIYWGWIVLPIKVRHSNIQGKPDAKLQ